jgi:hypothetical protein
MSKAKPCNICGQRSPLIPIKDRELTATGPICPKCGHHEQLSSGQYLWAKLFYSLPLEKQALLLGVSLEDLPPIPPAYRKAVPIDKANA